MSRNQNLEFSFLGLGIESSIKAKDAGYCFTMLFVFFKEILYFYLDFCMVNHCLEFSLN